MQLEGRRGIIGNQSVIAMTNMKQIEIQCNVYISMEINQTCSRIFEFSLNVLF